MPSQEIERLMETLTNLKAELIGLTEGVDSGRLTREPAPGKWSANQILSHLQSAEARSVRYLEKKVQGGTGLPRAGLAAKIKLALLTAFLRTRLKAKAPPEAGGVAEAPALADVLAAWETTRAELETFVAGFPEELEDRTVYRHPVAGALTLKQALTFMIEHKKHHLPQIRRGLAAGGG